MEKSKVLVPADMKRFTEFLDGESLTAPLRLKMAKEHGENLSLEGSNFDNQIVRVYCQRYDCFDQYKDWVAFFEFARARDEGVDILDKKVNRG